MTTNANRNLPKYTRLPPSKTACPLSGLGRAKLCQLILPCDANGGNPPVASFSVCPVGKKRGTRLIVVKSLMDYLAKLERQATA